MLPRRHRNVKKSSVFGHSPFCLRRELEEILLFLVVGPDAVEDPEDC